MFSVSPAIAWLIAGIAVLGAEIFLGTAYLLVVAFAFGATAAGAAVGLDFTMRLSSAQQCSLAGAFPSSPCAGEMQGEKIRLPNCSTWTAVNG